MIDRAALVAELIRTYPRADRGELLHAILARWPDLSGTELQKAVDLATRRPQATRLRQVLSTPARRASCR